MIQRVQVERIDYVDWMPMILGPWDGIRVVVWLWFYITFWIRR